jgi:hypothetical protein
MRGLPYFNFPAFHEAAVRLQFEGHSVFNPAARDADLYGSDLSAKNLTGDEAQAACQHGFSLREALAADTEYICMKADAIAMLPGWRESKGAKAEHALAEALGLQVRYL